ncbi:YibL family ribosome-associated protein [Litoribacillus peritrichatus]|uniref:YibL family ribosome-associated protein n=1 Tax=Litoribacillus peritrichatus TaxID=718191 RepID=A0ABP7N016_9GAMM
MNLNKELQQLQHKLDKLRNKLVAAEKRDDPSVVQRFQKEISVTLKKVESIKGQKSRQVSSKSDTIKAMPFHRELTKTEQADMGKLKKSVRGLVVVHPMTALGKEMGITKMTGYAPKEF